LAANELLIRQPGIISLHAVTTTNAIHHSFTAVGDDGTRRMLLLQNASFVCLFRDALASRGAVGELRIDEIESSPVEGTEEPTTQVFSDISSDPGLASRRLLGLLETGARPEEIMQSARRLVFLKGNDSHDYKFSSAVMEDFFHVSPGWRNRCFAAAAYLLPGSGSEDNGLVQRIRAALS
jgi:hypothetical protein